MHEYKFSASALRRAWDARVRRGDNLHPLFPELLPLHSAVREVKAKRRDELRLYKTEGPDREAVKEHYREELEQLSATYDSALEAALERTALEIQKLLETGHYGLSLISNPPPSNDVRKRPIYALEKNTAAAYFLARQVEHEIAALTPRTMADRNILTRQFATALENTQAKIVIRTDIRNFYESIEHSKIRQLLRDKHHVSRTAYKYVDQLLENYSTSVGAPSGIPRGMAISAKIAEMYMSEIDRDLNKQGVIMYLRYVDDIVIVANALAGLPSLTQHRDSLMSVVQSHGLELNRTKTRAIETPIGKNFKEEVEFLGYDYILREDGITMDISKKRFERYKKRIIISLSAHEQQNSNRSFQMLKERMRFLTGNTRLSNNRRQALVGIYYSNSSLKEVSGRIRALDDFTRGMINKHISDPQQASELSGFSFERGFQNRTFSSLSPTRISKIVRVWKYVS